MIYIYHFILFLSICSLIPCSSPFTSYPSWLSFFCQPTFPPVMLFRSKALDVGIPLIYPMVSLFIQPSAKSFIIDHGLWITYGNGKADYKKNFRYIFLIYSPSRLKHLEFLHSMVIPWDIFVTEDVGPNGPEIGTLFVILIVCFYMSPLELVK